MRRQWQGFSEVPAYERAEEIGAALIERFSRPGDVVLDPFSGRGTVPLQACLRRRIGVGVDRNPLAALLTGTVCGLVNGLLVTRLGLSSLAVTIGTLALYRGLAYVLLGDMPVADFPMEWTDLGYMPIPGTSLPWVTIPMVVAGIVFIYVVHWTRFGRWLFAIGQGDEAAIFSGIPLQRVKLGLFTLTGAMCGFAGMAYTIRFASSSPDGALGYELLVIAAVLFGGVATAGRCRPNQFVK